MCNYWNVLYIPSPIARFMRPTWGPYGADRTQVGPMLTPWSLLPGLSYSLEDFGYQIRLDIYFRIPVSWSEVFFIYPWYNIINNGTVILIFVLLFSILYLRVAARLKYKIEQGQIYPCSILYLRVAAGVNKTFLPLQFFSIRYTKWFMSTWPLHLL